MDNVEFNKAKALGKELGISPGVAQQLLILSGDDPVLVKQASRQSRGLGECQARILDTRIGQIEEDLYEYDEDEDEENEDDEVLREY